MSVVEKFAAFVGSLSPEETGAVMPLMVNYMQGNLGAGMTGPSNAGPATALPPPPPGGDTGPPAPPPPGMSGGPEPLPPAMPGLQPGGLMGRPPMPPTQIGNKAY
jgi:hypothetical protein